MFIYSIQKFQSPASDLKFMLSVQQGAPFLILNSQKIMMTGIALHIDEWHRIHWHTNLRNISIQSQTTQSKCRNCDKMPCRSAHQIFQFYG